MMYITHSSDYYVKKKKFKDGEIYNTMFKILMEKEIKLEMDIA